MTKNPAKVEEGEAKKRGDTVTAQQADAAADAHKNTGAHGTHTGHTGAGVGATGAGAGIGSHTGTHDHHSHTGPAGTTGTTGINTGSHTGTHTGTGTGTGFGHKAPGEPTMGDKITGTAQSAGTYMSLLHT